MNRYVLFPFRGGALVLALTFTLGQVLAVHAGFAGIPLALALLSWFFKYCFVLLDAIIIGADEPPVLSIEMINPVDEQRPVAQAILIAAGAMLAVESGKLAGPAIGWMSGMLLLFVLPASIGTMGMTGNALRAAWPPELWSLIHSVGRDYLLLVCGIVGLAGLVLALAYYAPVWLLIAGAHMALLLTFALVGSVVHEHRLELGIEYRTMREHIEERSRREHESERNRMMDHAYMKFRVGKPGEGWQEIEAWLQSKRAGEDPGDKLLLEHRAVLATAARWEDVRAADRLTNELVELYFARRETGRALDAVEERLAANPKFRPTHAAHTLRLAELAAAAGKRALRRQLVPDQDGKEVP
jgi:hypothetical protein